MSSIHRIGYLRVCRIDLTPKLKRGRQAQTRVLKRAYAVARRLQRRVRRGIPLRNRAVGCGLRQAPLAQDQHLIAPLPRPDRLPIDNPV